PAPLLEAGPTRRHERVVLATRPGRAATGCPRAARPTPATRFPLHRSVDRSARAGAGGLPLVAPRPQPTTRVRLDGNAPERSPADLQENTRSVRWATPAT